jgi:hypothetical protein
MVGWSTNSASWRNKAERPLVEKQTWHLSGRFGSVIASFLKVRSNYAVVHHDHAVLTQPLGYH